MNILEIEKNIKKILENFSEETFIYDFLLAYGLPKATITRLKSGNHNLSKKDNQIILKNKLFFEFVKNQDLHVSINTLKNDEKTYSHRPRFIIVTDYQTLLAIDTKTNDSFERKIDELGEYYDFFLPLAGMEKAQIQIENPADIRAAVKMASLYDEILKENPDFKVEKVHSLNVFLSRLLFCFFAEDTSIFEDQIFTNTIKSVTQLDGSDLKDFIGKVFEILNTKNEDEKRLRYPDHIKQFPYVNGGLFRDPHSIPKFSRKARNLIVECGTLNWKEINPDIFGSMMQAVIDEDMRSGLGMHYTSVPNIMKVIEPLFLDNLKEEFENSYDSIKKLEKLLKRIYKIKIFDPACGSGNFLIIAYKELRLLEMEIFKRFDELKAQEAKDFKTFNSTEQIRLLPEDKQLNLSAISSSKRDTYWGIHLNQFYGIEIDDFACETAKLSLWLAEHQMNMKFKAMFEKVRPSLPLQESGKIVCGNATRINWEDVCPSSSKITISEISNLNISETNSLEISQIQGDDDEIYILGNPPYRGARLQDESQKEDMRIVFNNNEDYKDCDYISCWFIKGANYINKNNKAKFAFVSTNSICQGEQVSYIWPRTLISDLEIFFAYTSFKWSNNAKNKAGVTCIIVGVRNFANSNRYLYKDNNVEIVKNISPYLTKRSNVIITPQKRAICKYFPQLSLGNMARDGGNLILSTEEKNDLIEKYPEAIKLTKKLYGSQEFIKGYERWCLWINDEDINLALSIPVIQERVQKVYEFRVASKAKTTNQYAKIPHRFAQKTEFRNNFIILPRVSSERRNYIPIGFLDKTAIASDSALAIYDAEPYVFGILASKMHMTWVRAVGGQLETRIRYSAEICYNTFPFPAISQRQKDVITQHVFNVLDERNKYPEKTMAELYDPDKMPDGLIQAHQDLDIAIEQCYKSKPFTNDEERLEYLFDLHEKMIKEAM